MTQHHRAGNPTPNELSKALPIHFRFLADLDGEERGYPGVLAVLRGVEPCEVM